MGRSPMSDENGVKKGPWTPEEDEKLIKYIQKHGHGSWRALPSLAGLRRCGKSCRLRWTNYLRPDIKRGKFSQEEEQTILNLHAILGNKWSTIATHLPGRTDNEIKNFWNTHLKKKLIQMGFDPMTHRPRTDIFATLPHLIALANLIDNPDHALRLQSEALQMARLNQCLQLQHLLQSPISIPNSLPNDVTSTFNLLNSLKDNSILTPPPPQAAAAAGFLPEAMQFAHMPDLQAPCSVDQSSMSKGVMVQGLEFGENSPVSSSPLWLNQSLSPPQAAAPVTETSVTNNSGLESASSYGAAQMWSELLDDPIFHEIA